MLRRVVLAMMLVAGAIALPAAGAASTRATAGDAVVLAAPDDSTPPTVNEFLPEDRSLGDCISALPKPGCGSEARGGWRQGLILLAIVGALAFIAWRTVRAARGTRTDATASTTTEPGTRSAQGDPSRSAQRRGDPRR